MIVSDALILERADLRSESRTKSIFQVTVSDFINTSVIAKYNLVLFIDDGGNTVILKNRYGSTDREYHTREVGKIVKGLFDQVEYLHNQYIKCREYISRPWWNRGSKWSFLEKCRNEDDESHTIIFDIVKFAEKHPGTLLFLKEFFDKKSIKNN